MSKWKFISSHAMALYLIDQNNAVPARNLVKEMDITERSVRRIIKDLQDEGYLRIQKDGRSNRYEIQHNAPLRRVALGDTTVGELLTALSQDQM